MYFINTIYSLNTVMGTWFDKLKKTGSENPPPVFRPEIIL